MRESHHQPHQPNFMFSQAALAEGGHVEEKAEAARCVNHITNSPT